MNLFKSLITISTMTMISRLFGFIRDITLASIFGTGMEMDAFIIAFRLPNSLRRIFAEGAFSQAFIPILVEYKNQHSIKETHLFISYISGTMSIVLLLITILGILYAPYIIFITAPGYVKYSDKLNITISLLRIIFPYIYLISLSSLVSSILNTWNIFYVPAISPVLLNISIILFAIFISPYCKLPIISLAWAVIIGGILQLLYQLIYLKKIGMLLIPKINFKNIGILKVFKKMIPAVLGVSASQISMIINNMFASFLVSGSLSWIYYADRLMEFPIGVLGITLSTILLPALSKRFMLSNYNDYSRLMDWGLRMCFLLALPSTIALNILSKILVSSLFQYNKFNYFDVLMTQYTLMGYSIGLIGLILVKVLVTGFYSIHNTKTPIKIAVITLILTQIMNLFFVNLFKHVGLSISISIASCFNASMLYWQLRKKKLFIPQPGWKIFFIKICLSVIFMAIVLFIGISFITLYNNILLNIINLLGLCFLGILSYFFMLKKLGFCLKDFYSFNVN